MAVTDEQQIIIKLKFGVVLPMRFTDKFHYADFLYNLPLEFLKEQEYYITDADGVLKRQFIVRGLNYMNFFFTARLAEELIEYAPD